MQGRTAESLCPAKGGEGARLGRDVGGKRRGQRSRGWGSLAGVEGPCRPCGGDKTGSHGEPGVHQEKGLSAGHKESGTDEGSWGGRQGQGQACEQALRLLGGRTPVLRPRGPSG